MSARPISRYKHPCMCVLLGRCTLSYRKRRRAGIDFIAENGGGPGVLLRDLQQPKAQIELPKI